MMAHCIWKGNYDFKLVLGCRVKHYLSGVCVL